MKTKKYNEADVIAALKRKQGISIALNKVIELAKDAIVGNGTWGKIDYLKTYCGYSVFRASSNNNHNIEEKQKANRIRREDKKEIKELKVYKNRL